MKLWCTIKSDHKIIAQHTSELPDGIFRWDAEALHELIGESCSVLDTGRPVVLQKHADEMARHGRTVFKATDFIEHIAFDQMEFELIDGEQFISPEKRSEESFDF